ncbi:MAG TPA: hypothetical protein VN794_20835, partial [Methylomirabilota bacterium]|nr:hypothetical protein [Methylomirabilota bacterium]
LELSDGHYRGEKQNRQGQQKIPVAPQKLHGRFYANRGRAAIHFHRLATKPPRSSTPVVKTLGKSAPKIGEFAKGLQVQRFFATKNLNQTAGLCYGRP